MSNLATVQQIYTAFGQGDVATILDRLSEGVEWEHDALDHGIPWLRPGRGRGHALEYFHVLAKELAITRFDVTNLLEGGAQVVAVIQLTAEVRRTRAMIHDCELHLWTFDEDGKVARFRHVVDTQQHLRACGKS